LVEGKEEELAELVTNLSKLGLRGSIRNASKKAKGTIESLFKKSKKKRERTEAALILKIMAYPVRRLLLYKFKALE